jgi:Xaa-Pro aminopeptidase
MQVKDYSIVQYKGNIVGFLADLITELKIENLGFEEEVVTFSQYSSFKEKFNCELTPLDGMVENIRVIKNEAEIASIKKAAEIADNAFEHMRKFIKVGMTELEIALELEFFMKKQGAKFLSFPSIVASGYRSSLPHGEPTNKVVQNGEFLTLDYGCVFEEYCSDMTRTFVIGQPDEKMLEVYNTVLEAQLLALEAIKPGVKASLIDKIARDYITKKGYGDYFGHGLGHGVGREIHEAPSVNSKSEIILSAGMVITDEPGIYLPNFGGVRIEDLVVVTENGCETLSKSNKQLIKL